MRAISAWFGARTGLILLSFLLQVIDRTPFIALIGVEQFLLLGTQFRLNLWLVHDLYYTCLFKNRSIIVIPSGNWMRSPGWS